MKPALQAFIDSLEAGRKPTDLRQVSNWLAAQQVTADEWDIVSKAICTAYGFKSDDELANKFKRPTFTHESNYEDDFMQMIEDIDLGGWLGEYVDHTRGMEAPTAYHFAVGLTVLGAVLKRQVFVDQGYYKLWPAVQTLLVGPSGKVKKSTAAGYGVELGTSMSKIPFNVLPDEGSGEALKTELARLSRNKQEATGLLYVSELGTFLGKQEYNVNLVQALTDLFDSRTSKWRKTHAQGNQEMRNIALSALFCSNEDWLADAIPSSAFGGGFFGRMLVYYQRDTNRLFPRPKPANGEQREILQAGLVSATLVRGEAVLSAKADKWYEARYREIKKEWPDDERLVPFWERIPDHLLRLGMLLSISENLGQRDSVAVGEKHLIQADGIVRWIVRYLPRVYSHLGGTTFGADQQRIYSIIKRRGGQIEEKELGRKMARRMNRRALNDHLETMRMNGIVERVKLDDWIGQYGWRLKRKFEEVV